MEVDKCVAYITIFKSQDIVGQFGNRGNDLYCHVKRTIVIRQMELKFREDAAQPRDRSLKMRLVDFVCAFDRQNNELKPHPQHTHTNYSFVGGLYGCR